MLWRFDKLLPFVAVLAAITCLPTLAPGDEPPEPAETPASEKPAGPAPVAETGPSSAELVLQLGDASYKVRQQATKLLEERGIAAQAALRNGLRRRNPLEVRMRCDRLLSGIVQRDIQARLQALLEGDDKRAGQFPGWDQFRETAGASKLTRQMYVDMYTAEQNFLDMIRPSSEELTAAQRMELTKSFNTRLDEMRNQLYSNNSAQLTWKTFTAMLLVAADPNASVSPESLSKIYTVLSRSTTQSMFNTRERSVPMKKVLSSWLEKASGETYTSYYTMSIALRYKLPVGVKIARDYVKRNSSSSLLSGAILAIAANGDKVDLPLLEKQLANTTVCHTHRNAAQKTTQVQVRDVALAATIHIHGKDPKDFGYKNVAKHPDTVFAIHTLAFENNTQRDAVRKAWDSRDRTGEETEKAEAGADTGAKTDDNADAGADSGAGK